MRGFSYPGQSGAQALANAIYGTTNPSGRLPITFFKAGHVDEVSVYDMGMRPNASVGNPGRSSLEGVLVASAQKKEEKKAHTASTPARSSTRLGAAASATPISR